MVCDNSKGVISQTIKQLGSKTILDDVEEKYLYPSQAWASISTGLGKNHKIRWYNDAKADSDFYWRNLEKNVALMNVLPRFNTQKEENFMILFFRFFSLKPKVKLINIRTSRFLIIKCQYLVEEKHKKQ